jgi:hypothetical protein
LQNAQAGNTDWSMSSIDEIDEGIAGPGKCTENGAGSGKPKFGLLN